MYLVIQLITRLVEVVKWCKIKIHLVLVVLCSRI